MGGGFQAVKIEQMKSLCNYLGKNAQSNICASPSCNVGVGFCKLFVLPLRHSPVPILPSRRSPMCVKFCLAAMYTYDHSCTHAIFHPFTHSWISLTQAVIYFIVVVVFIWLLLILVLLSLLLLCCFCCCCSSSSSSSPSWHLCSFFLSFFENHVHHFLFSLPHVCLLCTCILCAVCVGELSTWFKSFIPVFMCFLTNCWHGNIPHCFAPLCHLLIH